MVSEKTTNTQAHKVYRDRLGERAVYLSHPPGQAWRIRSMDRSEGPIQDFRSGVLHAEQVEGWDREFASQEDAFQFVEDQIASGTVRQK